MIGVMVVVFLTSVVNSLMMTMVFCSFGSLS